MKNCNADANADKSPLGEYIADWTPPPRPPRRELVGRYCIVAPLDVNRHSRDLFAANQTDRGDQLWTYLPYGPFETLAAYQTWMTETCRGDDPLFFAIINNKTNKPEGVASYLRVNPAAGSIEVGHINYSPPMQRTPMATEAMYLMMQNAFVLGYRRYEWKCNALNQNSCAAARRLGFKYEGVFRQMMVVKNRNRDSAWFSVIDKEWPALQRAFKLWLADDNFDRNGKQVRALSALTAAANA